MNYEKVSVNIDDKKLSQMDLLIENGFYANRSDFINQAVEELLQQESHTVEKLLEQQSVDSVIINDSVWFIGLSNMDKAFLARVKELGKKISVKGFGVLFFDADCDAALVSETIEAVSPKIRINASDEIKAVLNRK